MHPTRKIVKIQTHQTHPGFMGRGHRATDVFEHAPFKFTDPFIFLMDDQMDFAGGQEAGGPHPHAGLETVTLVIESDNAVFAEGSFEKMTAGRGVVHTETISEKTRARILQLWISLPLKDRFTQPFLQTIDLKNVPTLKQEGKEIRVYSGKSQGLASPIRQNADTYIVDFHLDNHKTATQELPKHYNAFMYVIEGIVAVGDKEVKKSESAWFDLSDEQGVSHIDFKALADGTRFVLYAGAPQHNDIITHGPFVADKQEDIQRLYREYRSGEMKHINDLPQEYVLDFTSGIKA